VVGTERDLQCEIVRENVLSPEELDRWRQRIAGLPPAAWQPEQDSKPTQLMESGAGR
jgi:hypothetical protein